MNDEKLKILQKKIDTAQDKFKPAETNDYSTESMNKGMQVLTELIGILIASGALGYFLDYLFNTAPAFLLSLLALGIITFFYKLLKMTKNTK